MDTKSWCVGHRTIRAKEAVRASLYWGSQLPSPLPAPLTSSRWGNIKLWASAFTSLEARNILELMPSEESWFLIRRSLMATPFLLLSLTMWLILRSGKEQEKEIKIISRLIHEWMDGWTSLIYRALPIYLLDPNLCDVWFLVVGIVTLSLTSTGRHYYSISEVVKLRLSYQREQD